MSTVSPPRLSVILPVLNEAVGIEDLLASLAPWRAAGAEIIVVDGGSDDASATLAAPLADQVLHSGRGRARQMNAGAALAHGEILLFLHADTRLPAGAMHAIGDALRLPINACQASPVWGRFDVRFFSSLAGASPAHPAPPAPLLRLVARMMNLRSRLTGIATGDQAMFMHRTAFIAVGGFPEQPLMEDIALSRRLLRLSRPACLAPPRCAPAQTSARRWEEHGIWRTIFLMWSLRWRYFLGADPVQLARDYGYGQESKTP